MMSAETERAPVGKHCVVVAHANGDLSLKQLDAESNNAAMNKLVDAVFEGGFFKIVRPRRLAEMAPGLVMLVEDNGRENLPFNLIGSWLNGDSITGPVVLLAEVHGPDGCDPTPLAEERARTLLGQLTEAWG